MHHIDIDKHAVYVLFLVLSTGNYRGLSESYNWHSQRKPGSEKSEKSNQKNFKYIYIVRNFLVSFTIAQ